LEGIFIELFKIVRGIKEPVSPIKSEPSDIIHDGVHVFEVLFAGVGVVKSQIAEPSLVFGGYSEIETDRFGVSNVEITVGLRGKSGVHPASPFTVLQIFCDDVSNKVWCRSMFGFIHFRLIRLKRRIFLAY
jgi:hypothetical protein